MHLVAISGITSKPSQIPIPFTFWKAYLTQFLGLSRSGSHVASIAPLLGSEMNAMLRPKQSSRESYFLPFVSTATTIYFPLDSWIQWYCIAVYYFYDCVPVLVGGRRYTSVDVIGGAL